MARNDEIGHSVLIVSGSPQFSMVVRKAMKGFFLVDERKSAAAARRLCLERSYDIVMINAPLQDETGEQFALDLTRDSRASVLLVVPADQSEEVMGRVVDRGILVLQSPMSLGRLEKDIRFLISIRDRMREYEKLLRTAREKLEETRVVDKAKFLLIEREHMTEGEAHRLIGKQAMDNGITRKKIAERILEDYEE